MRHVDFWRCNRCMGTGENPYPSGDCPDCDGTGTSYTMPDETAVGCAPGSSATPCVICTDARAALAAAQHEPTETTLDAQRRKDAELAYEADDTVQQNVLLTGPVEPDYDSEKLMAVGAKVAKALGKRGKPEEPVKDAAAQTARYEDCLQTVCSFLELPFAESGPCDDPARYEQALEGLDKLYRQTEAERVEHSKARFEAEAKLEALSAQAVPEGWQLVPKKPTEAMTALGEEYAGSRMYALYTYEAMLAVAPKPETGGG